MRYTKAIVELHTYTIHRLRVTTIGLNQDDRRVRVDHLMQSFRNVIYSLQHDSDPGEQQSGKTRRKGL